MLNFEIVTIILRIKLFSLASLFLLTSIGFGVKLHYCHGNLSSITYITSLPVCDCAGEIRSMECCADVEQFYQLDKETIIPKLIQPIAFFPQHSDLQIVSLKNPTERNLPSVTIDPDNSGPPLYLEFHSLIFYA